MAQLITNNGERSMINTWLVGASGGGNSVPGSAVYVALGSKSGGIGTDKTVNNGTNQTTTLAEIGQTAANGYARQILNRNGGGATPNWPLASLVSTSYQSTATQVTFTFTGAPNLNGATLWFVALSATINATDALFGADLATTRTFANGDTEKVTVTYRQT
jgi:hypothetical protein